MKFFTSIVPFFTRIVLFFARIAPRALLIALLNFLAPIAHGQSILDPTDPVITFNPSAPPTQPSFGTIGKWVRTVRVSFNTNNYKCYIYNGQCFRLHFPKSYNPTAVDGKKYPILVFFHGAGEAGAVTDNENQLVHGGDVFDKAVTNGTFDGYVLCMQTTNGFWGQPVYGYIKDILDYMVVNNKLDPFRINLNGLSAGGEGTWNMMFNYPTYTASALPMSNSSLAYISDTALIKFTKMWLFQGGLDGGPDPGTTQLVVNAMNTAGSNLTYQIFPGDGHDTWDDAWKQANFWPFVNTAYIANPWPLGGRSQFCPGDPINVTVGLVAGMQAYQWRMNGNVIPGATSNSIQVTQLGTYDARVETNGTWSDWSHAPVVISIKQPTVSPAITIPALTSNVRPALDTTHGVTLQVPTGFASYLWQAVGGSTTLSTTNTLFTNTPGSYQVKVTEQFGCSSSFSAPFTVVNANGANPPSPAAALTATTVSQTALRLDWSVNPGQQFPQTGFEVYQGTTPGGPYNIVAILNAGATFDTVTNLNPAGKYYFVVRAVNANAAAAASNEASGTTSSDALPPTAPSNLTVTGTTRSTVSLNWTAATDNVGVTSYDIYINGSKQYSTAGTSFTVDNLSFGGTYTFSVTARDFARNISPFSNQVTAQALLNGFHFKYYNGTFTKLPNFNTLVPAKQGFSTTLDMSTRTQDVNFGYLWEGFLHVTVAGTYTFRTNSDDGSALYLGSPGQTTSAYNFPTAPLVNNDGLHGGQNANSTAVTLQVGVYPIAVAYFQQGSGFSVTASWSTPQTGAGNFVPIPLGNLSDASTQTGVVPAAPSNLVATALAFNKIGLTWTDSSNNETAFEVWRSNDSLGNSSNTIAIVKPNVSSYVDSTVAAGTKYFYRVRAIGQFGQSAFDNSGPGIGYSYYTLSSTPTKLPSPAALSAIVPTATGQVSTISVAPAQTNVNFILAFSGTINIPAANAGAYTFFTSSDDGSDLYIDGTDSAHLIVRNDFAQGQTERSGTVTLAAGPHTIFVPYFQGSGGFVLTASLQGPGISKRQIPASMLGQNFANATSLTLPAIPAAPTALVAQGTSTTSTVTIGWTDNAGNETNYQVFRSSGNNTNYLLLASLPANSVGFTDIGLFPNAVYFYKVRAVNAGGNSVFSNEDSAHTRDHLPVLAPITANQFMRYGTQLVLNVAASDSDAETLTTNVTNLPAFAVFSAATGKISFNPTLADLGVYSPITVTVNDQHGGSVTQNFSLTVNDNFNPVITRPVANVSMNENATATVNLAATDQNVSDLLTWSFKGLPGFATVVANGGSAFLALAPGLADGGLYTVQARVDDGNNGFDTLTFTINVAKIPLPTTNVFVHFSGPDGATAAAPWNNTLSLPSQTKAFTNLIDQNGAISGLTLTITTPWQGISFGDGTNTLGQTTGNNSGVFPDAVLGSAYYTDATPNSIRVSGMDTSTRYNFTFFGSRGNVNDDRTTVYSVTSNAGGTSTVSLQAANNTANTVSVNNVQPNSDGTVLLTLAKGANASFGYMNSVVIAKIFNDHTVPAKPRSIAGALVNNSQVALTWVAAAYNANSYQVYRSQAQAGPYTLLNPGATNPTQASFNDSLISQNNTYYYYVTATNSVGVSPSSDTVTMVIPNLAPVLSPIAAQTLSAAVTTTVNITATDDTADVITLTATSLPAFASFQDNGNGTGTISFAPANTDLGNYTASITAIDNHGASSTTTFAITVTFANQRNVFIHFNDGTGSSPAQGAPWNNTNSAPNAGAGIANLVDDHGTATGFGIRLVDAWAGSNNVGPNTGNNSGVFPDNVLQSFYFDNSGAARHMTISGLSSIGKYNVIFYAGRGGVTDNRTTHYTIGNQSVQLNAASNTTQTVQINNVSADASGNVNISFTQDAGSQFALINAIVLQYSFDSTFYAPSLSASSPSTTRINLKWVSNTPAITTGFELWRGTTPTGPFNLLTTLANTVTSYTDSSLAAGSVFFYEVRALAGTRQSAFSNIAGTSTVAYNVQIQLNDGSQNPAQGGVWNSTNTQVFNGFVLPNLIDTKGQQTGMNMTVVSNFSGYNTLGTVTGNNSGIFPDNVMKGFFYCDFGVTAVLNISGLDLTSTYNFNFFGSRSNPSTSVISTYQIGSAIATVDAANNTSRLAQIQGVKPDSTGTVQILMYNTDGGRAYMNAMVIDGVPNGFASFAQTPVATQAIGIGQVTGSVNALASDSSSVLAGASRIMAFPNPFTDGISLDFQLTRAIAQLQVLVSDASGKIVLRQELDNLPEGSSVQRLNLQGRNLPEGTYFISLETPGGKIQALQILKLSK